MSNGIFFVVFALGLVSARNDLELSPQSDLESMEEIHELLRNVQLIFDSKIANKVQQGTFLEDDGDNDGGVDSNGCSCWRLSCSCCTYVNVPKLNLKGNACLRVTYLRRNYGILVTLTYGSRTIFSREVSARNPPPICAGIQFLKRYASVCIQFYNLNIGSKSFSGCGRLLGRFRFATVMRINVGCFRVNYLNATQQVDAIELPYLDVPQEPLPEEPDPVYVGDVEMEEIKTAGYWKN